MTIGYSVPHAIPFVNIISYTVDISHTYNTTRNGISARGDMKKFEYYTCVMSKREKKRLRNSLIIGSEIKIDKTLVVIGNIIY